MKSTMKRQRSGFTLVEVLVSILLVAASAATLYQGMIYSHKTLMRSRAKLDAQGIAFDALWGKFNVGDHQNLPNLGAPASKTSLTFSTPENSVFSTNGTVNVWVIPGTNSGGVVERWEITAQVWAPENSVLFSVFEEGTVVGEYPYPLAEYSIIRYMGDRE